MVRPARTRALLLAARSGVQALLHPEGAGDADARRAFEDEAQESNARVLRWTACLTPPLNALAVLVFLRRPETDPAGAAWSLWLVRLSTMFAALVILVGIVAWRRRPAALWRNLGDVAGVVGLLGAAARSANAQRVHPNINLFVMGAFAIALFLRMRPKVFAPALLAASALVLAGIAYFRRDGADRITDELSVLATSSFAFFGFFFARAMHVRELLARQQLERRAQEIDLLNTQLDEKIRERSRELSMALARLAGGHRALEPGTVLGGRVEIDAWIGQGGMGVVYRGRDLVTDRAVAIKVVQATSATELDGLHRFLGEAQAMASVTHRAIVRSVHVDVSEDGQLFQVMELVEGETLESHLARAGALPPPAAARLVATLAEAVAAAHAAGVVHRDIKPSNVMLTRSAPGLKLLDFGVSKLWHATGAASEGQIVGTPGFFSPEQVRAPASVAAPADVYALGLLTYLCLANRMPFETGGVGLHRHPIPISKVVPAVDPTLARAVTACLHDDPAERPTASVLAATLLRVADAAGAPPLEELDLVQDAVVSERRPAADATFRSASRS
jgi:hypothetical protein